MLLSTLSTKPEIKFAVKYLSVLIKTEVTHPGKIAWTDNAYISYSVKFSGVKNIILHVVLKA